MMKSQIPPSLRAVLPLLLVLLWGSCSKSVLVDGPENGGSLSGGLRFELPGTGNVYENAGGEEGTDPSAPSVSPLPDGSKVRILAFRRTGGGEQPNPTVDEYMGEAVYVLTSGQLVPESTALSLPLEDTFDFYALTPGDLAASPSGFTVNVDHGADFASSVTPAVKVPQDGVVKLQPLVRRCTKVTAVTSLKDDHMKGYTVQSLELSELTAGPQPFPLAADLALDGLPLTGKRTFVNPFTPPAEPDPENPTAQESEDIVLPRKAGPFTFALTVTFTGQTNATRLTARSGENTPELKPGYHYRLNIKLQGAHAELWLTVVPWDNQTMDLPDLGAGTRLDLEILDWEKVECGIDIG